VDVALTMGLILGGEILLLYGELEGFYENPEVPVGFSTQRFGVTSSIDDYCVTGK